MPYHINKEPPQTGPDLVRVFFCPFRPYLCNMIEIVLNNSNPSDLIKKLLSSNYTVTTRETSFTSFYRGQTVGVVHKQVLQEELDILIENLRAKRQDKRRELKEFRDRINQRIGRKLTVYDLYDITHVNIHWIQYVYSHVVHNQRVSQAIEEGKEPPEFTFVSKRRIYTQLYRFHLCDPVILGLLYKSIVVCQPIYMVAEGNFCGEFAHRILKDVILSMISGRANKSKVVRIKNFFAAANISLDPTLWNNIRVATHRQRHRAGDSFNWNDSYIENILKMSKSEVVYYLTGEKPKDFKELDLSHIERDHKWIDKLLTDQYMNSDPSQS